MTRRICVLFIVALATMVAGHPGDGIVVDKNGDIYFVAMDPIGGPPHHAAVFKVTGENTAELIYKSKYESSNAHLTLGRDGHLYVAERNYLGERNGEDAFLTRIYRLNRNGETTLIHSEKRGRTPYGGSAYLVDSDATLVFIDGNILKQLSKEGTETTLATIPADRRIDKLAWGSDGEVYVMTSDGVHIYKKDSETRELAKGLRDVPFDNEVMKDGNMMFDMAVTEDGTVFLADWNHRRVLEVSPDGDVTTKLESVAPYTPEGLAYRDETLTVFESTSFEADGILPRIRTIDAHGTVKTIYEFRANTPTQSKSSNGLRTALFIGVFGIIVFLGYKLTVKR